MQLSDECVVKWPLLTLHIVKIFKTLVFVKVKWQTFFVGLSLLEQLLVHVIQLHEVAHLLVAVHICLLLAVVFFEIEHRHILLLVGHFFVKLIDKLLLNVGRKFFKLWVLLHHTYHLFYVFKFNI